MVVRTSKVIFLFSCVGKAGMRISKVESGCLLSTCSSYMYCANLRVGCLINSLQGECVVTS